ncbi:VOC family protein [Paenibacillus flagellatus]|nr:VOC family protein [Paenibacillus flagellatus]
MTTQPFVERIDAVFLPVSNLENALAWYTDVFGYEVRWKNARFAGLKVGPNVGFHLVETKDYVPNTNYCPLNFAVKDIEAARKRLEEKGVRMTELRAGEPVRFDFFDADGNMLTIIQM